MKSILIVIGTPDLRVRFSDILSQAGYHIISAESGELAVGLAKSLNPDLVLMAIVMQNLDGLQTASRLREVLSLPVPIVLLGTVPPIGIDEMPLASLVNDYLNLDVSAEQLLTCVARHTGTSEP